MIKVRYRGLIERGPETTAGQLLTQSGPCLPSLEVSSSDEQHRSQVGRTHQRSLKWIHAVLRGHVSPSQKRVAAVRFERNQRDSLLVLHRSQRLRRMSASILSNSVVNIFGPFS